MCVAQASPLVRHGQAEQVYFDFVYQPLREAYGRIIGVVVVASKLTEQVHSRQQVEHLNQKLEQRVQARTAHMQQLNAAPVTLGVDAISLWLGAAV